MTGLTIEIGLPDEKTHEAALQMESNYDGIHRKAIWEKVDVVAQGPSLLSLIQRPFLKRKYRRMLESFEEKAKDPTQEYYVDKVAKSVGIPVPQKIGSIYPKRYTAHNLARSGIEFDVGKKLDFSYIITHGM